MEIEWATFVVSATGENEGLVVRGPGIDTVLADWLPVEAKVWMIVSLRTNYQEFEDPKPNVLRAEIHEPSQRAVVHWMQWTMSPPTIGSALFQVGHSGREVKSLEVEIPAKIEGWYDVELSVNGGEIYLLHVRVAPKPEGLRTLPQ